MAGGRNDQAAGFFVASEGRDPLRAATMSARPRPIKRFYAEATTARAGDGYVVRLDGKFAQTPARNALVVPTLDVAQAVADEWAGQGAFLDSSSMPLTRLVNSTLDGVALRMAEVAQDVIKYANSDLICYRAAEPDGLARAQAAHWDALTAFAREALNAPLALADGVIFRAQPAEAIEAIARAVRGGVGTGPASPFRLAALHSLTVLTGSCVIALAVALRQADVRTAWAAANVDEDFQMDAWGVDNEAVARRERRFVDFRAAAFVSRAMAQAD